ncbi:MAG: DNA polymerase III subunit beta [Firmicutes bacterium]|nr:DNA polymerase III subunit beta [Bacillota bacterium]
MKLKIKQNILMEHLNYVIKGISNKNLIPILNCIKFDLTNEGLYLTSTDNEIMINTFIKKEDIENIDTLGNIVVSGRYIYDIIRKLPNEIIDIEEVMDSKVYISTSNSSFNLNCNLVNDFPKIELEESKNPVSITQKVFRNIINQTIFATSTQESRPVLTGINIKINDNTMECTATDSYRLAYKKVELSQALSENINIIIPTRNLNELIKLLTDEDELINIHIFNNKVIFKFSTIVFMSRLINGTYPDTSKLIPNEFKTEILVNLRDFYNSIDRASLLTNEADKNTIKLNIDESRIILTSNIPEIGNVTEKVQIIESNNNDIKIAFSSKYIMDALKVLDCEEVKLLFNGEDKPIILRNPESLDVIQLILPIRTY